MQFLLCLGAVTAADVLGGLASSWLGADAGLASAITTVTAFWVGTWVAKQSRAKKA